MKAYVLRSHGSSDTMYFDNNYPDPVPGRDDVILRVRACSLNYHDIFTRNGMPGITVPLPIVIGIDIAGEIVQTGTDVRGLAVGDRVLVDPLERVNGGMAGETFDGGLAEFVRIPAHMIIPLSDDVGYHQAVALPVAYGTAHRMMLTRGGITAGETVLILGASGGVGSCCVQLAKAAGATVIACASSDEKLLRLKELGADFGINYASKDWVAECHQLFGKARTRRGKSGGVDVVVNFTGGDTWTKSLRVLRRGGRILTCGATAGYDPKEDLRYIWTFELNILGSNGWKRDDILALLEMIELGKLNPVLHPERFSLERAGEAIRLLDERRVLGKVLVEP